MRILVMGGTGEVGHHVANGLAQRGHDVVVLARGKDGRGFERDGRIQCVQADKNEAAALDRAVAKRTFDVVIDTVPSESSVRNVHGLFARQANRIHGVPS
jgi:uncharacterized protein YbjT (DUF2867 family)